MRNNEDDVFPEKMLASCYAGETMSAVVNMLEVRVKDRNTSAFKKGEERG